MVTDVPYALQGRRISGMGNESGPEVAYLALGIVGNHVEAGPVAPQIWGAAGARG